MSRSYSIAALLLIFFSGLPSKAQLAYSDIELESIPFKKVRAYLNEQQDAASIRYLAELESSCSSNCNLNEFFAYKKIYRIKAEKEQVWDTYKNASPTQSWTNRRSSCALLYERADDRILYREDATDGIAPGQVLFMDLKLLKGLYHLATAFEITKVEDELGVIQIDYTEAGINQGMQIISMFDTKDGYTMIEHASFIRSGHALRDRFLYPFFHNKLINAFHRQMRKMVHADSMASKDQLLE